MLQDSQKLFGLLYFTLFCISSSICRNHFYCLILCCQTFFFLWKYFSFFPIWQQTLFFLSILFEKSEFVKKLKSILNIFSSFFFYKNIHALVFKATYLHIFIMISKKFKDEVKTKQKIFLLSIHEKGILHCPFVFCILFLR